MEQFIRNRRRIEISLSEPEITGSHLYDIHGKYIKTLTGQVPEPELGQILSDICVRQMEISGEDNLKIKYKEVETDVTIRRYIDITLGEILDFHAQERPNQEAIVDRFYHRRMTYQELKEESDALAKSFIDMGIKKGDHVAVVLDNSWENIVSKFAVAKIGGVVVNFNIHEKAEALEILLKNADVSTVILRQGLKAREYMDILYGICPELKDSEPDAIHCSRLPKLKHIIVTDRNMPRKCAFQFEDLLEKGKHLAQEILMERQSQSTSFDYGTIIHTSGTSGIPKGVIMKHYQIIESAYSHMKEFELEENDRFFMSPPMFHSLGCIGSVLTTLVAGAVLVFSGKIDEKEIVDALLEEQCTVLCSVPTIYYRLLNYVKENKVDCSKFHLRVCTTAGSACAKTTLREMKTILGADMIISMYGMTEAGPGITGTAKNDSLDVVESTVGKFWPGVVWEIRDLTTGKPVGPGVEGEICIKGFGVMELYYNNPAETTKAMDQEGWLKSGDIGVVSEDGYLSLKGRCKDLIIHGGENISPKEIEEFLIRYENIKEAAVVGMPDEQYGENVCAFITLKEDKEMDIEEIKSWCKGKIATMKIPEHIYILKHFPLTATGKIAKGELRKIAKQKVTPKERKVKKMAKIITVKEAADMINDGAVIGSAVQGMTGWPEEIGLAIEKNFLETGHPAGITHIHGAGQGDFGRTSPDGKTCRGECALAHDGLLTRSIHGHVGCSFKVTKQVAENKILAYNFPLGMMGQIWREVGRGFPGLLTKVGLGTFFDPRFDGAMVNEKTKAEGGQLVHYIPDFMGEEYLFYTLPALNFALLRATTADEDGNLTFEKECMPCEPLDLAMACKANGGKVIVQVERVAATGSLDPRNVKVPGILVDYICVAEKPERIMQTHITHFNPAFTGEVRIPMKSSAKPLPLDDKKVFIRRAAKEFHTGNKCNLGIGMPGLIPSVLMEEGVSENVTLISESGVIGGIPAPGGDFGAHFNPIVMYSQTDHFSFFDQGGLDIAVFGLSEVDKDGNVNTTNLNGKIVGAGGFPNIAANAKHSIFVGSFTAGGLKCHVEDGKMVIDNEGRFNKFVDSCVQLSFNADQGLKKGNKITFITERCVIKRTEEGMVLAEIAPGIDLQTQILDRMGFMPIIPEGGPKLMDPALFTETWGNLKEGF